ncbi:MAG: TldD/PmbA family protein [Actinomycetota bacterium]|jgi:PmbA protein|nr:TldD/PmbA family protein [Actinomycetota bacterium]
MDDLEIIAEKIVSQAMPGEEVEAFVAWDEETSIRIYNGAIENLSKSQSSGVGIRIVSNHRQGFAWAGTLDPSAVEFAMAEARDNASFATEDEYLGLGTPDDVAPKDLDLWRDDLSSHSTDEKVSLALELESAVKNSDKRIKSVESANYGDVSSTATVLTNTGMKASYRQTFSFISAYAIAVENDETQTGGGYSVGRTLSELDLDKAASDATRRATRLLGASKPPSARMTVLFDPQVTTTLLAIISGTLSGEAVIKGRSLFAGRLNEQVASATVSLVDDPTNPFAFGASVFDAEGYASRSNSLIADGVLQGFLYDTYSARRAGVSTTASAVRGGFSSTPGVGARALYLTPGTKSQPELIESIENGVLVQNISGVHSGVNPISGDFSVGAEGLLIKSGKLGSPVKEFTIASSLQRMLQEVVAVGNDVEWIPSVAAGVSLVVEGISLSGI